MIRTGTAGCMALSFLAVPAEDASSFQTLVSPTESVSGSSVRAVCSMCMAASRRCSSAHSSL